MVSKLNEVQDCDTSLQLKFQYKPIRTRDVLRTQREYVTSHADDGARAVVRRVHRVHVPRIQQLTRGSIFFG
jgi:hypothetical protein